MLSVAAVLLGSAPASAIFTEVTFLPVEIGGKTYELEVMLSRPAQSGRFPVAVITHGTTSTGSRPRDMRADSVLGSWVRDFASRGYLAVGIMRRGYGLSDGPLADDAGKCANPDPQRYIDANADDIEAALVALRQRTDVDLSRLVGVGQSLGALTLLALDARRRVHFDAIINVSGGLYRYENRDGLAAFDAFEGCDKFKQAVVSAIARYGATSRAPTHWFYSQNDPWFVPEFVAEMKAAWTGAGAKARLVTLPPSAVNGHDLFYDLRSRQLLMPEIDGVLRSLALPTWDRREANQIAGTLSPKQREQLERYLAREGAHKAIVISPADPGDLYWSARHPTIGRAVDAAMAACVAAVHTGCRVLMKNFTPTDKAAVMSGM